jgi:hypothetical protein
MAETYFLVTLNEDGSITTQGDIPAELPTANRKPNNYDVYQTSKQIVEEFESSMLADKISSKILSVLAPQDVSVSDKVKEALKERGVTPEGA